MASLRLLALLIVALASGCLAPSEANDDTLPWTGDGESIDVSAIPEGADGKADATSEVRVRSESMTVWIRPVLDRLPDGGAFVLRGRASRNLERVLSFIPDDEFGSSRIRTARTFEVVLEPDQARALILGRPLLIALWTRADPDARVTVQVTIRPRFSGISGTHAVRLENAVTAPWVNGQIVLRAHGNADASVESIALVDHLGVGPSGTLEGSGARRDLVVDVEPTTILQWANVEPLRLVTGDGRVKRASLALTLTRLRITTLDPYDVWPSASCEPEVLECLEAIEGAPDTSTCGEAFEVRPCLTMLPATPSLADTFAADLRAHLVEWYALHGDDVAASGGNTLALATAAVDAAQVVELTNAEEDPNGHDLRTYRVLRHADVVWPGSDTVWFGVYDRASSRRIEITDFN